MNMNWYLKVLSNYVGFSGRSRRKEFWIFNLINTSFAIFLTIIDISLFNHDPMNPASIAILSSIYFFAVALPSFAVMERRLHDTDRSAWWMLLLFLPIIGAIILIVFLSQDGTPGDNRFGSNPKENEALYLENRENLNIQITKNKNDLESQLKQAKKFFDQGLISQDEYDKKRGVLLNF
jgi:uncharacterized membrane protein YhaH (DUF805 family)